MNKKGHLPSAAMTVFTWGSADRIFSGKPSAVKSSWSTSTGCLAKCRFLFTLALIIWKICPLSTSGTPQMPSLSAQMPENGANLYKSLEKTSQLPLRWAPLQRPVPKWVRVGRRRRRYRATNQPIATSLATAASQPGSGWCCSCALGQKGAHFQALNRFPLTDFQTLGELGFVPGHHQIALFVRQAVAGHFKVKVADHI